MVLRVIGVLLIVFGVVDFGGSFVGFDLWGSLGVPLPEIVWRFSAWIEIAVGLTVFRLAHNVNAETTGPAAQ